MTIDEATRISLEKQIKIHTRRLNILREKQALKGINVAPEIILEIEDIEEKLAKSREQLAEFNKPKKFLEVTLDEQFTPELLEAARRAFAGVVNIPVDRVKVAYIRDGSVVLLVQMPEDAANQLISLYESGEMRLPDLIIKQIQSIDSLSRVDLQEVSLTGFDLSEADLRETDLRRADLRRANLSGANLSGANLSGVNLKESDLRETNLSRADLRGVNLSGVNLSGANLSRANLSGANLSGADLSGANLSGGDLSETDLTTTNLIGVISDEQTKWPWQHDYEKVKI